MIIEDYKEKYRVQVDRGKRLILAKCIGMWTIEDYNRFIGDIKRLAEVYFPRQNWAILQDLREYKPSTQVIPEIIHSAFKEMRQYGYRYGAIVAGSPLIKMQFNRGSEGVEGFYMNCFEQEKEAEEWLCINGF